MKIEILGTGCPKCKALGEVAINATKKVGVIAHFEKIEDITKIMEYGVTSTPALVIDGEVKLSGRVPSVDEVVAFLKN